LGEVAEAILAQTGDKSRRLMLALELIDAAMRTGHGFFEYWTALEVVVAGKVNRMKSILSAIYGVRSHHEVGEQTGLNVLARWRHEYVHKGIRPPLTADIERYLQLLFLDLLRHELGLPSRKYVVAVQNAVGYDLSSLGLANDQPSQPPEIDGAA
jgi:hypothetical protein